ncbi:hypothetical protein EI94DRAFT_1817324 [Lactarius quietus]|nr:hypothetical protein EI94DRAFT_1817324 [Lactarius quietus]
MAPFFVGPMLPGEFLSTFFRLLKSPSLFQAGMFDALAGLGTEAPMYKIFVDIVQPHLQTLHIYNTSHTLDKATTGYSCAFSYDCMVYSLEHQVAIRNNSTLSNIYIEFKVKSEEDAFSTNTTSGCLINERTKGFLATSQITAYAVIQLDSQYHTHVFSVLIIGDHAWLI